MSALTGTYASPSPEAAKTETVRGDGWWPDVDMAHLAQAVRVPTGVTDTRLVELTRRAILSVNNELARWKAARFAQGYASLADVPTVETIDGDSGLLVHYRTAVYSEIDARLSEQYRSMDTTGAGDKRADMLDPRIEEARRDKRWAITAILQHDNPGHQKVHVELI